MTKTAMIEELKAAGIILKNVKKMARAEVEEKYNEYKNNTKKEKNTMNNQTTFVPATDRLPETTEKYTVYGMTEWTVSAPKKERKTRKERKPRNNMNDLLEFVVDTWEAEYGRVEVASYVAKTSFAALKVAETGRQVIKVVWTNSSVKLAFRIAEAQDVFDNMKVVNYTMPYQITFTEDTPEVRDRILKAFPLAATLDVKKSKKAKKEENAQ